MKPGTREGPASAGGGGGGARGGASSSPTARAGRSVGALIIQSMRDDTAELLDAKRLSSWTTAAATGAPASACATCASRRSSTGFTQPCWPPSRETGASAEWSLRDEACLEWSRSLSCRRWLLPWLCPERWWLRSSSPLERCSCRRSCRSRLLLRERRRELSWRPSSCRCPDDSRWWWWCLEEEWCSRSPASCRSSRWWLLELPSRPPPSRAPPLEAAELPDLTNWMPLRKEDIGS